MEGTPLSNIRRRRNDEEEEEDDKESFTLESPIRTINPAGRPPEAGIIKRIHLENFMCHRKMNFMHGQNGSGKSESAILAAIQICLRAGARRTHRARNLQELVRQEAGENCNGAKVRGSTVERNIFELVDKIHHLKHATTMSFRKYEEMEPSVEAAKNQMDGIL